MNYIFLKITLCGGKLVIEHLRPICILIDISYPSLFVKKCWIRVKYSQHQLVDLSKYGPENTHMSRSRDIPLKWSNRLSSYTLTVNVNVMQG